MRRYFMLVKKKMYFGLLVILACACFGSVRGALKESGEPFVGVTQEDTAAMQEPDYIAPDLIGIIPLAAEQNRWRNFSYAVIYAGRGFFIYCVLMIAYLPLYHLRCFEILRAILETGKGEEQLFIGGKYFDHKTAKQKNL